MNPFFVPPPTPPAQLGVKLRLQVDRLNYTSHTSHTPLDTSSPCDGPLWQGFRPRADSLTAFGSLLRSHLLQEALH